MSHVRADEVEGVLLVSVPPRTVVILAAGEGKRMKSSLVFDEQKDLANQTGAIIH